LGVLGRPRQRLERWRIVLDWFGRHLGSNAASRREPVG